VNVRRIARTAAALVFGFALGPGSCSRSHGPAVKEISVNELNDRVREDSSLLLIDVRSDAEYEAVHALPVKRLIPHSEILDSASHLPDRDTPIYFICRSGRRSGMAARALAGLGYENVYNVAGGTNAWVAAGLPTDSGRGILSPGEP